MYDQGGRSDHSLLIPLASKKGEQVLLPELLRSRDRLRPRQAPPVLCNLLKQCNTTKQDVGLLHLAVGLNLGKRLVFISAMLSLSELAEHCRRGS